MVAPTAPAGANRGCALRPYPPRAPIPTFKLGGECVAYASPDSTWAVTREMVDGATRTILIGIYDFTSGPVKELLLAARRRGVEVTLMLDVERSDEAAVFDELARAGVRCVAAPACTHPDPARRVFASSHEKVVVVDGEWTLVQSGNYSANGIPVNPEGGGSGFVTGNRETGVAVHSPEIARFFTDLLLSDVALARETADETPLLQTEAAPAAPTLFLAAPATPPKLFPRQRLEPSDGIEVLPVLSPDSYMDVVPPLLAGARASILIEQQYIKARQPATRELLGIVRERLDAVPGLDVRIILGRVFDAGDRKDIQALADDFGLRLGTHVRLINTAHFVHCHNKMVLVDRADVLVGSQNWSDYALTRNREASLLFRSFGALAGYFGRIFEADWENASPELPPPFDPRAILSDAARGTQPVVPLEPGDFVHV
jgi:phosphatidylserine/phosphatidylglycerophosphate/cardiolipin synthase-like enzyme